MSRQEPLLPAGLGCLAALLLVVGGGVGGVIYGVTSSSGDEAAVALSQATSRRQQAVQAALRKRAEALRELRDAAARQQAEVQNARSSLRLLAEQHPELASGLANGALAPRADLELLADARVPLEEVVARTAAAQLKGLGLSTRVERSPQGYAVAAEMSAVPAAQQLGAGLIALLVALRPRWVADLRFERPGQPTRSTGPLAQNDPGSLELFARALTQTSSRLPGLRGAQTGDVPEGSARWSFQGVDRAQVVRHFGPRTGRVTLDGPLTLPPGKYFLVVVGRDGRLHTQDYQLAAGHAYGPTDVGGAAYTPYGRPPYPPLQPQPGRCFSCSTNVGKCMFCRGAGQRTGKCVQCTGGKCRTCAGSGEVNGNTCHTCAGRRLCRYCLGRGLRVAPCRMCNGSGRCRPCGGTGRRP